jgi:hypothetical protein
MAMGSATTAGRRPGSHGGGLTLREALREHPAGPELVAALGALADRPAVARMGPVASGGARALPGRSAGRGAGGGTLRRVTDRDRNADRPPFPGAGRPFTGA